MSPIVWDLGHIANFEEQWVDRVLGTDADRARAERDSLFDAIAHPRSLRGELEVPGRAAMLDELARVRRRTRATLRQTQLDENDPLLQGGYVYRMLEGGSRRRCGS